jgi:manganese transport protein
MAILPSLVIALMAGDKGADQLIILSQVILSVLLPFSLIPLVKITSCPDKMGVFVNSYMVQILFILDHLG